MPLDSIMTSCNGFYNCSFWSTVILIVPPLLVWAIFVTLTPDELGPLRIADACWLWFTCWNVWPLKRLYTIWQLRWAEQLVQLLYTLDSRYHCNHYYHSVIFYFLCWTEQFYDILLYKPLLRAIYACSYCMFLWAYTYISTLHWRDKAHIHGPICFNTACCEMIILLRVKDP